MSRPDNKVGEYLKKLAKIYGIFSEIGVIAIAITVAENSYDGFSVFCTIFFPSTFLVLLSTALLYAAGVLVDNVVLIREKVVGTDEELGRNQPPYAKYTVDDEIKKQDAKDNITVAVDGIKSQAEKTIDVLKSLGKK